MSAADVQAIKDYIDEKFGEIGKAVWATALTSRWTGAPASAESVVTSGQYYSIHAGFRGVTPETAKIAPGTETHAKLLADQVDVAVEQTEPPTV